MPRVKMFITTETDYQDYVLEEVKKVEGVEEASVYGNDGIVVKVKADTMAELKEIMTWQIRRIAKIKFTSIKAEDIEM